MTAPFDPYHRWLGIAPDEQPPHHYRLLGLKPLEDDPDVIDSAAVRQMSHVRSFQSGKHGAESQRILNELAAARIVLLNPEKKRAYDAQLREQLAERERRTQQGRPVAVGVPVPVVVTSTSPLVREKDVPAVYLRWWRRQILLGFVWAAIPVLLICSVVLLAARPWESKSSIDAETRAALRNLPELRPPTPPKRLATGPSIPSTTPSSTQGGNRGKPASALPPPPVSRESNPAESPPVKPAALPGLVAHWTFDEGAGDVAHDAVGGHDGAITGATWQPGARGTALHFDGKSAVVRFENSEAINYEGPITMTAWIRPEHRSPGITFMDVLNHQGSQREPRSLYLRICNGGYAVGCYTGRHDPTERQLPDEDIRAWVHLAGAYDGQSWHIYRNGEPFCSHRTKYGPLKFDGPWTIGGSFDGSRLFQGDIDEVQIFNRALSAEEIAALAR